MAMENVGRFLGKYAMDEALQAQLEDKTPEEVVTIAKEAGFDFTVEELKEATQPIQKLTPEELDATTGEISGTIVSKYGDNCVVRFLGNLANKF